jgi:hypothetical protein
MWTAPLCDSRNDHLTGNALLGAGVVHHINSVVLAPQQFRQSDRPTPELIYRKIAEAPEKADRDYP